MQARLASQIHTNPGIDPSFHYGNLCFWRDSSVSMGDDANQQWRTSAILQKLTCRTLVHIIRPRSADPPQLTAISCSKIEAETMASCKRFVESYYELLTQGQLGGSFIDAYDIVVAGVTFYGLVRATRTGASDHTVNDAVSIIHKCSILITEMTQSFPALKTFQRTLQSLSCRLLGQGPPRSPPDTLDEESSIILRYLHGFIKSDP